MDLLHDLSFLDGRPMFNPFGMKGIEKLLLKNSIRQIVDRIISRTKPNTQRRLSALYDLEKELRSYTLETLKQIEAASSKSYDPTLDELVEDTHGRPANISGP